MDVPVTHPQYTKQQKCCCSRHSLGSSIFRQTVARILLFSINSEMNYKQKQTTVSLREITDYALQQKIRNQLLWQISF